MQRAGSFRFALAQPGAQDFVPRGAGRQTVQQRAQIESCAACHNRQTSSCRDFVKNPTADPREIAGRKEFVRVRDIDQMMRDAPALFRGQLGGPDVEEAVDLHRVAVHDFAFEFLCQLQGELALPAPGRTGDGD